MQQEIFIDKLIMADVDFNQLLPSIIFKILDS